MSDAVLVAGAGSWGTALAILLARNGQSVRLWAHRAEHAAALARDRCNRRYLPGVDLPAQVTPTADLAVALRDCRDLVLAVPLRGVRSLLADVARAAPRNPRIVAACKGFEAGTQRLVHEVVADCLGPGIDFGVLSGPTFAAEVVAGRPAAAVVASGTPALTADFVARLHGGTFRLYTREDVVGVEVAGATKNVVAIAAGVLDGLGLGANARAALVTRGLAEMMRLGLALGGVPETFMGLAGLGDLVLTCTDDQSRNRRLGLALGHGRSVAQALATIGQAVEGAATAQEVEALARRLGVEMPICSQVAALLRGEVTPPAAVGALLAREPRPEA